MLPWHIIKTLISGISDLAWPNLCLLCDRPLVLGEKILCMNCLYDLPKTGFNHFRANPAAERFYGKIAFEKATAGFRYQKESKMQLALELLKYKGEKELGEVLAAYSGSQLIKTDFFNDIDLIIPVPLHSNKIKERGYNQSVDIARGLSQACGIPYETDSLKRVCENTTQTTKSIWERWENSRELFAFHSSETFKGKHLLLTDDVLTSGSTLCSCGEAIQQATDVKISFYALALA